MGIIKSGKVVIILRGRYAGRKGIVIKTYDDGHSDRRFGHAIVAGRDVAGRRLAGQGGYRETRLLRPATLVGVVVRRVVPCEQHLRARAHCAGREGVHGGARERDTFSKRELAVPPQEGRKGRLLPPCRQGR